MIDLEELPQHLSTLKPDHWAMLFDLLPEMEGTDFGELKGGQQIRPGISLMPYWDISDIVLRTIPDHRCPTPKVGQFSLARKKRTFLFFFAGKDARQ